MSSIVYPNTVNKILTGAHGARSGQGFLKYVELGTAITNISTYAFENQAKLVVVIHTAIPPTTDSNIFRNIGDGRIYVPDDSVSAYKSASGWAQYASIIKGISEYTGDFFLND